MEAPKAYLALEAGKDISCSYPLHSCYWRKPNTLPHRNKFKDALLRAIQCSDKNFWSIHYLRTKGAIELEIQKQKHSEYWYIVHPFSLIRLSWEMFMLCIFCFFVFFMPIRSCFVNSFVARFYKEQNLPQDKIIVGLSIDFCFTVLCFWEMTGNFFTGYYKTNLGVVEMNPEKIIKKYLLTWFAFDFLACIPLDILVILLGGMDSYTQLNSAGFTILALHFLYSSMRFRNYLRYIINLARLRVFFRLLPIFIQMILTYIYITSWAICLMLTVPLIVSGDKLLRNPENSTLSWIQASRILYLDLAEQYELIAMKGVFNSLGLEQEWSKFFVFEDYFLAFINCIWARLFWLFFFLVLLNYLSSIYPLRMKFSLILGQLKTYMKQKEFPTFLKKRLNRFYLYRFQAHYFRDRSILVTLTQPLRKEISMYTCQRLIHGTKLFQPLSRKVIARVVQKMNREMYFPNDVIIQCNTFGESMYFICSGTVSVSTVSGKFICTLEDGDFFGEIALLTQDRRRTATVVASTITEVYRLDDTDFKKITEKYPEVHARLKEIAEERYNAMIDLEKK